MTRLYVDDLVNMASSCLSRSRKISRTTRLSFRLSYNCMSIQADGCVSESRLRCAYKSRLDLPAPRRPNTKWLAAAVICASAFDTDFVYRAKKSSLKLNRLMFKDSER